ncbi:MAG: anti-sigma factor [Flavobacteriaceae bacterium]
MEKKLHNFLNSGLLDKYVIGATTEIESKHVESYIKDYPEIEEEYHLLQEQLEFAAITNAAKPSKNMLPSILEKLDEQPVITLHTTKKSNKSWYSIAASVAALVFASYSFMLYNKNQTLVNENNTIADEIFDLRKDINDNNNKLDNVLKAFNKLNNPETEKYVLRGNERAKDLKTVAYINPIEKSSLIDVVSLPKLSDEQTYQMWANLQDKKINLGTLDASNGKLKSVPYIEDALSLSITIEPKNGKKTGTVENSVAEIPLKNKNN